MDNHNPTPWRIADDDKTKIVDAAGELVTFVTNDFSSYNALADNAALIVRAVNKRELEKTRNEESARLDGERWLASALALVKEHFDGINAEGFQLAAVELADRLDAANRTVLARYVRSLIEGKEG